MSRRLGKGLTRFPYAKITEKRSILRQNHLEKVTSLLYTDVGWLAVLRINVDLAIFQPYLDFEAGDKKSLKIQVARPGIEPRSSCSARQELNHSAIAAPYTDVASLL